jgi:hypothetical protein
MASATAGLAGFVDPLLSIGLDGLVGAAQPKLPWSPPGTATAEHITAAMA